jgi:hypothetical protein
MLSTTLHAIEKSPRDCVIRAVSIVSIDDAPAKNANQGHPSRACVAAPLGVIVWCLLLASGDRSPDRLRLSTLLHCFTTEQISALPTRND